MCIQRWMYKKKLCIDQNPFDYPFVDVFTSWINQWIKFFNRWFFYNFNPLKINLFYFIWVREGEKSNYTISHLTLTTVIHLALWVAFYFSQMFQSSVRLVGTEVLRPSLARDSASFYCNLKLILQKFQHRQCYNWEMEFHFFPYYFRRWSYFPFRVQVPLHGMNTFELINEKGIIALVAKSNDS